MILHSYLTINIQLIYHHLHHTRSKLLKPLLIILRMTFFGSNNKFNNQNLPQ